MINSLALREEEQGDTPLQIRLGQLVGRIVWVGSITAIILFLILFIKFLTQLHGSQLDSSAKGQQFVQILIISTIVLVIAVPEGLPLAVTLALAYTTTRMLKDNNLVRVLKSCETMGNATTICSDKTGTLTQNQMTVVAATFGVPTKDGELYRESDTSTESYEAQKGVDSDISLKALFSQLSTDTKALLRQSIAINSTAFEGVDAQGIKGFIGSKTETALLEMAKKYLDMSDLSTERDNVTVVQHIPFNPERKWMGVIVKAQLDGQTIHRLFVKGASEILLKHSDRALVESSGEVSAYLTEEDRTTLTNVIDNYANQSLRTLAVSYRNLPQWSRPEPIQLSNHNQATAELDELFQDMTWIGIVGIKDPLRSGVVKAVQDCQNAGVKVIMVTGDSIITAKAIATECRILDESGIAMEGSQFRSLSSAQLNEIIPRLQVLARSSPQDKYSLVKYLKEMGETVAVTGDGTNDGPALKIADVGFAMGISGTEVAKEASDIIIMDDNFASIVKSIMWGRCISDAVKKFLQVVSVLSNADAIPVSANRQRQRCTIGLRFLCRQRTRGICSNRCATFVG